METTTMTTTITKTQINKIARATKTYCHRNGYGMQIVVFADGSYQEAFSSNDVIARRANDGGWEYPILRLSVPCTRDGVTAAIADALDLRVACQAAAASWAVAG
jgi:hypothetical protein